MKALLWLLLALSSSTAEYFDELWLEKAGEAIFTQNGNKGRLSIPEYNITEKGSVVGILKYTGEHTLTVACSTEPCEGIIVKQNDAKELKVVDTNNLNYEEPDSNQPKTVILRFMLEVTDWNDCGKLASECAPCTPCTELTVELENINDVAPDIQSNSYVIDLWENQDNASVIAIAGVDSEFPELTDGLEMVLLDNQETPFSIVKDSSLSATWNLDVKNLDYDTGPTTYRLKLELTDQEDRFGRSQTSTSMITINVRDEPDNAPDWRSPCTYISKEEELDEGFEYFKIKATDRDSEQNSQINYKILNQTYDYFDLKEGEDDFMIVYNKVIIDRDVMDKTSFVVSVWIEAEEDIDCVPVGDCTKSTTMECLIGVTDINDNAPTFTTTTYTAQVSENALQGVPFTFKDDNGESPKIIDNDVDYANNQFYSEFENSSLYDSLTLSNQTFVQQGTVIIMPKTSDNKLLDYEDRTEFSFTVKAKDIENKNLFSVATFKVEIIDVNDCTPEFEKLEYTQKFKEDLSDLPDNFLITTVKATDKDISENFGNASIRYNFNEPVDALFMNEITGEVFAVEGRKDFFDADKQTHYTFEITAADCRTGECPSDPSLTNTTKLLITVENVNDNPPEADDPDSCTKEFKNTVDFSDDIILILTASDADKDKFTFSIPDSPSGEFFPFFITEDGKLKLNKSVINEQEGDFTFLVRITDDGLPIALSSDVTCTMNITDVNDKDPVFEFPKAAEKYWIDDASEIGQLKLTDGNNVTLRATDGDVNECFHNISYKFDSTLTDGYEEFFDINGVDGVVFLLKNLTSFPLEADNEENGIKNLITLPVVATDSNGPTCPDGADSNNRKDRQELKLKVFTNFPPEFEPGDNVQNKDLNEFDESSNSISNITFDLTQAIDNNNIDHPDDFPEQEICYFFKNPSADILQKFSLDKNNNTLTVIEHLDADCVGCNTYNIEIVASNNCEVEPENSEEQSIQNVTVTVNDLNDNIPQFDNIKSFYVLSTTEVDPDCKDCDIAASDADRFLDKTLNFTIISQEASDVTVNVTNPFRLDRSSDTTFKILKNDSFNPQNYEDVQVYFDLLLQVKDSANHKTNASVKIVMMTAMNNITFGFDNTGDYINEKKDDIFKVLNDTFNWSFSNKGIREQAFSRNTRSEPFTTIEGYFVDPTTFKPKSQSEIAAEYDRLFDDLYVALYTKANVTMDGTQGFKGATTDDFYNPDKRSFMIVGSVAGGLVAVTALFLLVAYCVRTSALERRVKAYDADAVEEGPSKKQDKIFLSGLQETVPGSNEFAESGANPIWQAAMESNDYDEDEFQFGDDVSESSGDSILIGVEDQTEFDDYAAKMKEVEVDMDLYSRVQAKYKTLDDYQVPDEDTADTEVYSVDHAPGRNPVYQGDSDDDSA